MNIHGDGSPFVPHPKQNGGKSSQHCEARIFAETPEDEICISGLSGQFPSCRNVADFEHNLYNKIDMVSDQWARWPHYHPEIPKRMGNIFDIDKFDAQFFGVHNKQADIIDPQGRLLQERAYEAITDAGINPKSLRGSRTGVYIGACFAESERTWFYDKLSERGFGITGCSRAMMSNRISYSLGLQGPSFLIDTACSSSMYALDVAFSAIRSGQCEAAIVGGSNLLLHPTISLQFSRLGVLAQDGYCRPFDKDASGYVRAEAISTIFLQKAKDAKRIYAKVLYSKTNCDGHKVQGITYPSGRVQQNLLTEFYSDMRLDPSTIGYVEAHSTGTVVGDPEECTALNNVFCQGRDEPLLVGSVKSNIGHSESSSGVCSIAKVILAFERGEVAPNINFNSIRPEITGLVNNRMKVCTQITPLPDNTLVGINSFGFGGANAHALFQGHSKTKLNRGTPADDIPRLVNWSGRTEESISVMIDYLQSNPLDAELIGLLHNIQSVDEPGFIHRGYGVFTKGATDSEQAVCLNTGSQRYEGVKQPLVWIFSGMGSQWPGMGSSLMSIPIFAESIRKSHEILEPFGINVLRIITDPDKSNFDDIINSFVGIAAIQIAIVDILNALELKPDYIIGHSVGELGCGYADGALNHRQMILSSYYRGLASKSAKLIRGSMAAVGLGYSAIVGMLPADIEVACHNSAESTTISGPEASITKFVAELTEKKIFARAVNCSHIAYHSRYVSDVGQKLLELTKDLYPAVKRSDKWLSTSVPKSAWTDPKNQISSPEYFANNLLKSVLFEETSALLPENMVAIEIAPHGLLQAIIKRSMPNAVHIPLTQRGHPNNASFFLSALGKLFMNGYTMPLDKLYPEINYPVSRGTAKISPLLRWNHSDTYYVSKFETQKTPESGERKVKVNLATEEFSYIDGHTIDGRCLFPATGYLELVWETFAMMKGSQHHLINVEFEDIQFLRATALQPDADVELTVMIHYGKGSFEVSEGSTSIVTGFVREVENNNATLTELPPLENTNYPMLDQADFYKELRLRGYHYKNAFQSVVQARSDGVYGKIRWQENWVSFMDCILQIMILSKDTRSLMLPTRIQKIRIFPKEHMNTVKLLHEQNQDIDVYMSSELNIVQAGGVEIIGMVTNSVARRKAPGELVLESYKFVENQPIQKTHYLDALRICIQLIVENNPRLSNVKAVEIQSDTRTDQVVAVLDDIFAEIPLITSKLTLLTDRSVDLTNVAIFNDTIYAHSNCHMIIASDSLSNAQFVKSCEPSLMDEGFLLFRESLSTKISTELVNFNVILNIATDYDNFWLLRRKPKSISKTYKVIDISKSKDTFDWLDQVKESVKDKSLLLVAQHDEYSGIIGLVNCIRREPETKDVCCVFIDDERAPKFDVAHPVYARQLALNLAVNVFRKESWGTFRHLKLIQEKDVKPHNGHLYANVLRNGDLSSFSWMQGPLNPSLTDGLVRIQYASINFRDVMLATGRLSAEIFDLSRVDKECVLGLEYAGTTQHGQRVMGMVASGSMATLIQPYAPLTWIVPPEWNLKEAATVPVVYVTVYCAFFMGKAISAGKSILIHAGSGGVGLAAIRVALAYGMEVYTTVSTNQKKKYIMDMFPRLKESNIGNSRDCSFERLIKLRTRGKGVDFVLNSLSDEKLLASIRCLGRAGVFLEIGKFDLSNDTKIGLGVFLKEMSFRSVLADNLFLQPPEETRYIHGLIERDLKTGIIQPLNSTVFQVDEIEKAYRYLSTGQHMGKVLIQVRNEATDEWTVPIDALPRAYFDPTRVYIIPGGLGGFGLELADWLILRGARKIVLSSSRGLSNKYQAYRIRVWQNYGCQVIISTADITTLAGCKTLIAEAQTYGQIDGIFNLAVSLRDGVLDNQNTRMFKECWAPKADATAYLDAITRQQLLQLKYFVAFSSISCGRGNAGQSNYGLANSVMERIVEKRVADGLSGKAIQWGAIGEVGLAANMMTLNSVDSEIAGTLLQRISSCLAVLDPLLTTPDPVVGSMVVAKKDNDLMPGKNSSLIETVLNIMSIRNLNSISMTTSLSELGMDSLMTIEIKQALEREFEIYLSTQDLRSITFLTLQQLSEAGACTNVLAKNGKDFDAANTLFDFKSLLTMTATSVKETPIYRMPSKSSHSDVLADNLLIMPGVEGDNRPIWRSIAKQVNARAFICKYSDLFEEQLVPEMAKMFAKIYQQTVPSTKPFVLIGYSFGTLLAIEIARILESTGMTGQILCIDGAPAFLKKLILKSIDVETFSEAIFEQKVIFAICNSYLPESKAAEITEKVHGLSDWNEKMDTFCAALNSALPNKTVDTEFLCNFATGLYRRGLSANLYPTINVQKIRSNITLVRATAAAIEDIDERYELQSQTEGSIILKYVEGNHQTVLESEQLIEIINQMTSGAE